MKKIKIVSDVYHTPIQKTEGAAAYDCFAFAPEEDVVINPNETKIVSLGFSVEVPKGYYMEVRGRSGLSSQGILVATGTVDSDYRGIVGAIITNTNDKPYVVKNLSRVAQVQIKKVENFRFVHTDKLTVTKRGSKGFGSTGV